MVKDTRRRVVSSVRVYGKDRFPGRLFIVEGIDGSGKSTQLALLQKWLESEGYGTFFSEWNSSALVRDVTRRGKKKRMLTPMTFSLIHATDFADRTEQQIIPPLKAGALVLADRYVYTAFARDVARGVNPGWVRNLYQFAVKPTIAFYFRIAVDDAMKRIVGGRDAIKYYEAGMDRQVSGDIEESFRLFQGAVVDAYDSMVKEFGLVVIDASRSIEEQQAEMRRFAFYGQGLPAVKPSELKGKLVVLEGTDGVGRSTHIGLLREWLESRGHAVLDTGMTRSALAGKGLKAAKEGHTLGGVTMSLFYATDFADRLENEMIPALRAGFVVLTDRYTFSLMARATIRGADPQWVKGVYEFALKPDIVVYLRATVDELTTRVVQTSGFNYWESGMDLRLGDDMFDSFTAYQGRLLNVFDTMTREYEFHVVDS